MAPTPGAYDLNDSQDELSGPSSLTFNDSSMLSNLDLRLSSRNTSTSGPSALSSVPLDTPSPSNSLLSRHRARNDTSGRLGDTPLQPPARLNTRGLSEDDSTYGVSGLQFTPSRGVRVRADTGSDTPVATSKEKKSTKRSNAVMTLREQEKVRDITHWLTSYTLWTK